MSFLRHFYPSPIDPADLLNARKLSRVERRMINDNHLHRNINIGLTIAVVLGIAAILIRCSYQHGMLTAYLPAVGAALAGYGAAIGAGGLLGFLFGIPVATNHALNIASTGPVAVSTGSDGGSTVTATVPSSTGPAAKSQGGASASVTNPGDTTGGSSNGTSATLTAGDASIETNGTANTSDAAGATVSATDATSAASETRDTGDPTSGTATPVTSKSATPPPPTPPPTTTNVSNLEQVADTVTKLLLGGGLTQVAKFPPLIWSWAHIVAVGIAGNPLIPVVESEQAFAAGLLVYGFILGFFAGFLITKLQLGKAIAE